MTKYSTLEQVKIRLEQFHIDTVDNGRGNGASISLDVYLK